MADLVTALEGILHTCRWMRMFTVPNQSSVPKVRGQETAPPNRGHAELAQHLLSSQLEWQFWPLPLLCILTSTLATSCNSHPFCLQPLTLHCALSCTAAKTEVAMQCLLGQHQPLKSMQSHCMKQSQLHALLLAGSSSCCTREGMGRMPIHSQSTAL